MTDQNPNTDEANLHSMEPFPEPNTYPKGWDLDSILNPRPAKKRESEPLPDWYEHFQEPNTYPPCWDF